MLMILTCYTIHLLGLKILSFLYRGVPVQVRPEAPKSFNGLDQFNSTNVVIPTSIKFMSKVIKIIGGPNGSGKTTFAETFFAKSKQPIQFLNPDLIAAGFGPADPEKASFQAGRVLLAEIKDKIQKGHSFAFESTLSGLTYASIIKEAKKQGYEIIIYFVFLNKVSLNISRIKKRVEQGGHHIPTKTVRRRHLRCFENFWNIYRLLSDEWIILDNSKIKPKLIQKSRLFNKMSEREQTQFSKKAVKGFS